MAIKKEPPTKIDWREKMMSRIRQFIQQADPTIIEEIKYRKPSNPGGIPVWYNNGMLLTGETYKEHLRLGFAKGPALKEHDPKGLINSHRAIILREGDTLDGPAFKKLIKAAVALNKK